VLVKDKDGKVKEHKLGKQAGKRGMGVGVALGAVGAFELGPVRAVRRLAAAAAG
jgi:hypothetical protein